MLASHTVHFLFSGSYKFLTLTIKVFFIFFLYPPAAVTHLTLNSSTLNMHVLHSICVIYIYFFISQTFAPVLKELVFKDTGPEATTLVSKTLGGGNETGWGYHGHHGAH